MALYYHVLLLFSSIKSLFRASLALFYKYFPLFLCIFYLFFFVFALVLILFLFISNFFLVLDTDNARFSVKIFVFVLIFLVFSLKCILFFYKNRKLMANFWSYPKVHTLSFQILHAVCNILRSFAYFSFYYMTKHGFYVKRYVILIHI